MGTGLRWVWTGLWTGGSDVQNCVGVTRKQSYGHTLKVHKIFVEVLFRAFMPAQLGPTYAIDCGNVIVHLTQVLSGGVNRPFPQVEGAGTPDYYSLTCPLSTVLCLWCPHHQISPISSIIIVVLQNVHACML